MIPLCLVTGFLGSGKTTLLRRIVRDRPGRRLLFLVNEFSAVDVDGPLVREAGADVVSLPGGSIFCKCLVSQFISQMKRIAARAADAGAALEGVVIEASGMASPGVIATMLAETGLDRAFRLAQVVVVADPARYLKLRHTLPAVTAQVQAASLVLLNKLDRCTTEEADRAEADVRQLRPTARILRTTHCDTEFELFPESRPGPDPEGGYAACRDPNFATLTWAPPRPVEWDRFESALRPVLGEVFRMKGHLPLSDGANWFVEFAGDALTRHPIRENEQPAALVLIARGGSEEAVRAALARSID
jgi:G3E family GTPase